MTKSKNGSFHQARRNVDDEFYTQLTDIEKEMKHYRQHFKDKVVFCNCDDPEWSNFWKYFYLNFKVLGLKKLISTHYEFDNKASYKLEYDGTDEPTKTPLEGNGDFRSDECVAILKESDICCSNPPFSLFREYIALLIELDKKFLIIGGQNAITYKEVFPLIRENKVWLGNKSGDMSFKVPADSQPRATRYWVDETGQKWRSMGNICWYTNLDHKKRHEDLLGKLYKKYSADEYPQFDNYNVINVNKVLEIPIDYYGEMGVPITYLDKYNPDEFEILDANTLRVKDTVPYKKHGIIKDKEASINGIIKYARIVIRRKERSENEN